MLIDHLPLVGDNHGRCPAFFFIVSNLLLKNIAFLFNTR
ncbi:unnamed protein product, partial [Larinioides sclopetarius]